tara:strand:- start:241 stop:741 length:501 start_codon:yes stop_codon:yes gene_type:complete
MKNNPFKMKNPMLIKSAKDNSPMQLNYNGVSPVKNNGDGKIKEVSGGIPGYDYLKKAIKIAVNPFEAISEGIEKYKKSEQDKEIKRRDDFRKKYRTKSTYGKITGEEFDLERQLKTKTKYQDDLMKQVKKGTLSGEEAAKRIRAYGKGKIFSGPNETDVLLKPYRK